MHVSNISNQPIYSHAEKDDYSGMNLITLAVQLHLNLSHLYVEWVTDPSSSSLLHLSHSQVCGQLSGRMTHLALLVGQQGAQEGGEQHEQQKEEHYCSCLGAGPCHSPTPSLACL